MWRRDSGLASCEQRDVMRFVCVCWWQWCGEAFSVGSMARCFFPGGMQLEADSSLHGCWCACIPSCLMVGMDEYVLVKTIMNLQEEARACCSWALLCFVLYLG